MRVACVCVQVCIHVPTRACERALEAFHVDLLPLGRTAVPYIEYSKQASKHPAMNESMHLLGHSKQVIRAVK